MLESGYGIDEDLSYVVIKSLLHILIASVR